MMMTAYTLHDSLPQIIIKNHNRRQYTWVLVATFLAAIALYILVGVGGSAAIRKRTSFKAHPETIEDYFESGGWEVSFIEWVYLLHLLTAFPYLIMVSK